MKEIKSYAEFEKEILDKKKTCIVMFTATWCGPCRPVKKLLLDLDGFGLQLYAKWKRNDGGHEGDVKEGVDYCGKTTCGCSHVPLYFVDIDELGDDLKKLKSVPKSVPSVGIYHKGVSMRRIVGGASEEAYESLHKRAAKLQGEKR